MTTPIAAPNPPARGAWTPHEVRIAAVQAEIAGVNTFDITFENSELGRSYRFQPGQFNMLYIPGAGEMAISVSDDPARRDGVAHTIRTAGNVSGSLARMKPGDTLGLRGPFGAAWPLDECEGRDVIVVAGGIGLAPLRPVIYQLLSERDRYRRVHLLLGARSPDLRLYSEQYTAWADGGISLHQTVDRAKLDWTGNVGVVTLLLDRLRDFDPQQTTLFCCGPEVMMRFAVLSALQCGVGEKQIWISMERNMQCAIGLCGHCQLGPTFVCKNGPVFRYDLISPYLDVPGL